MQHLRFYLIIFIGYGNAENVKRFDQCLIMYFVQFTQEKKKLRKHD